MARIPIGMNLWGGGSTATWYTSTEQPFINIWKTGTTWAGNTGSSGRLTQERVDLDSNGYPQSFTVVNPTNGDSFTELDFLVLNAQPSPLFYTGGTYVCAYDGSDGHEQLRFDFDGGGATGGGGRITFTVTPSFNGIKISITAMPLTGHLTNFRLFKSTVDETSYNNGESVNPDFVSKFSRFNHFRFMDWLLTVGNTATSGILQTTQCFWTQVPVEFCVAVCNKLNGHMWLNIPNCFIDSAVVTLANTVHNGNTDAFGRKWAGLNSNLRVYLEFSNEWWNAFIMGIGGVTSALALLGYQAYPSLKSFYANLTATVDNGSGGAGNILHVTACTGNNGNPGMTNGAWHGNTLFGSGIGSQVTVLTGPGGTEFATTGDYTISGPALLITTPTAMTQGSDSSAQFQYCINRSLQTTDIFQDNWSTHGDAGRVTKVVGAQAVGALGGGTYIINALPTDWGGFTFSANCHITAGVLTIDSSLTGTPLAGQKISGAGVQALYIESNISGSGVGSTWQLNKTVTVSSNFLTGQYWFGSTASNFDAFCIAPYFGATDPTGLSADTFFNTTAPSDIAAALAAISQYNTLCQANHLGLVSYEGGQHYTATSGNISNIINLDPRMYSAYKSYLSGLGPNGLTLFTHYSGVEVNSGGANWGATPSLLVTPSAIATDGSAKFQALLDMLPQDVGTVPLRPVRNSPPNMPELSLRLGRL